MLSAAPPLAYDRSGMFNAIVIWIHILAAVVFIGPQIFLAAAAVPAMRTVSDVEERARATRIMTGRFGWLGGAALLTLIVTGIINYQDASNLIDVDVFPRYFFVMQAKLTLVTLVVLLTLLHGAVFGRRLQRLQLTGAGEAEIASARRWSLALSMTTLVLSIAILLLAALLDSDWSKLS